MHKLKTRALIPIVLLSLVQCANRGDEQQQKELVRQFVESVYYDTDFHRTYLTEREVKEVASTMRPLMTAAFLIGDRDEPLGGEAFEFPIHFSNGAGGHVTASFENGSIRSANIIVEPGVVGERD